MEQRGNPDLAEVQGLISKIRTETANLKQMILSELDVNEETEILSRFDSAIQAQVFSSLVNLSLYQLRGWKELVDE